MAETFSVDWLLESSDPHVEHDLVPRAVLRAGRGEQEGHGLLCTPTALTEWCREA